MKKDIHPNYRKVCFKELSTGYTLITGSTLESKETIKVDGTEYPLIYIEISSASHPFYTGEKRIMKTGAVDRFQARMAKTAEVQKDMPKKEEPKAETPKKKKEETPAPEAKEEVAEAPAEESTETPTEEPKAEETPTETIETPAEEAAASETEETSETPAEESSEETAETPEETTEEEK